MVGRPRLFSDDPSLVYLLLECGKSVGEFEVFLVDVRNFGHLGLVEGALGFELKPFSLETVEGLLHAEFDEEVSQKFVAAFLVALTDFADLLVRCLL